MNDVIKFIEENGLQLWPYRENGIIKAWTVFVPRKPWPIQPTKPTLAEALNEAERIILTQDSSTKSP